MWSNIKSFLIKYILDICLIVALSLACISYARTLENSRRIDEISVQVSNVQKDVAELNKAIIERLDVMQAQLDFITKYSEANYLFFYGDVDGRVNSNNKTTTRTKNSRK